MNEYIEFPVVVDTKDDLRKISEQRGRINSDSYQLGNDIWAPGSLVFSGFAGARQNDGKYHGAYRFRLSRSCDKECGQVAIDGLPGCRNLKAVVKNKNKRITKDGSDTHTDKIVG